MFLLIIPVPKKLIIDAESMGPGIMANAILTNKQAQVVADKLAMASTSLTEYADDILDAIPEKPYGIDEDVFAAHYPDHPLASPNLQKRVDLATRLRDTARVQRQPFPQTVLTSLHDALFDCAEQVRLLVIETLFYAGGPYSEVALNTLLAQRKVMRLEDRCSHENRFLRAASERFSPPILKQEIITRYRFLQVLGGSIELICDLQDLGDNEGVIVLQEQHFDALCKADHRTLVQVVDRRAMQMVMDKALIASMEKTGFTLLPRHATVILLTEGSPFMQTRLAPRRWAVTRPPQNSGLGVFFEALMGWR